MISDTSVALSGSLFPPGTEDQAKQEIAAMLKATKVKRVRDEHGVIQWREVPDYPMRYTAAVKILEFNVGKPVNRTITADVSPGFNQAGASSVDDLFQLLCGAPETAAEILEKLKKAALKAKRRESVEIPVNPPLPEGGAATP